MILQSCSSLNISPELQASKTVLTITIWITHRSLELIISKDEFIHPSCTKSTNYQSISTCPVLFVASAQLCVEFPNYINGSTMLSVMQAPNLNYFGFLFSPHFFLCLPPTPTHKHEHAGTRTHINTNAELVAKC